jgi:hypothetical protein
MDKGKERERERKEREIKRKKGIASSFFFSQTFQLRQWRRTSIASSSVRIALPGIIALSTHISRFIDDFHIESLTSGCSAASV